MTEALERLLKSTPNASDVGYTAMYWSGGPMGPGPCGPSMGMIRPRGTSSMGFGGGYGPVSGMDLSPIARNLLGYGQEPKFKANVPQYKVPEPRTYTVPEAKEPFSVYSFGTTELHVHKSGMGSIVQSETREPLYRLGTYQTAMAEHDLQNEIAKMVKYCNRERDR